MRKVIIIASAITVITVVATIRIVSDPDLVISTSKRDGFRIIRCNDPDDFKESICVTRVCKNELVSTGHIAASGDAIKIVVTAHDDKAPLQVEGILRNGNAASGDSGDVFRCLVIGGAVDKIEVVTEAERFKRVAAGTWEF